MVKRESIFAVIIGLLIGLLVTGGILRARSVINQRSENNTPSETNEESENESNGLFLEINSPKDNSISSEDTISLTGQTMPGTYIAIVAENSEHLIVPNDVGQFTQELELISGANTIKITVYTTEGEKVEKTLNVVYTTAEI